MERKKLIGADRKDLAKLVEKVKYDYEGYDINSFEVDGRKKFIEVKTTSRLAGSLEFFLTHNELTKAQTLANYSLYIVFDILSPRPRVWKVGNPFSPENPNVKRRPIKYKVTINLNKAG